MNPVLACLGFLLLSIGPPSDQEAAPAPAWLCPPCGAECHFSTYPGAGACGVCGMDLVPLADVPQVGVLVFPGVELVSSALALGVLGRSNAARAFTVADVAEPLRVGDLVELRPQFGFADAPALDVLVIPDGYGSWEDELVVEWVRAAAERAEHVVAIGNGILVLARAGLLAGERVPATLLMTRVGEELAPELVLDGTLRARQTRKLRLARDAAAAADAALEVVRDLAGEERARRTAEGLGLPWTPEAR